MFAGMGIVEISSVDTGQLPSEVVFNIGYQTIEHLGRVGTAIKLGPRQ
jgi:hypothetical protein